MQPIGAHGQIGTADLARGQRDRPVRPDPRDRRPDPQVDAGRPRRIREEGDQVGAVDQPVRWPGKAGQVEPGEAAAARPVARLDRLRPHRGRVEGGTEAEGLQRAGAVRGDLDAGPGLAKAGMALEQGDEGAGTGKGQRGGQPADPAADDVDLIDHGIEGNRRFGVSEEIETVRPTRGLRRERWPAGDSTRAAPRPA